MQVYVQYYKTDDGYDMNIMLNYLYPLFVVTKG